MATDGIKILDSDLAHDTYTTIIGLFEDGMERNAVFEKLPFIRHDYGTESDYYHELFVTSYALACWELGWLSEGIMQEVEQVIGKGASVASWIDEYGAGAGKSRQNVLNRFWLKINSTNPRPRKRRIYKQTEVPFFDVFDLLAYKTTNGIYRVHVCATIKLYKGKHCYTFSPTSYFGGALPTVEELHNFGIYGVRIGVSGDKESVSQSQNGVEELWDIFSEKTLCISENGPFIIGLRQELVLHKDLMNFRDKFVRIGSLKIKKQFNKQGSASFCKSFEEFDKDEQLYNILKFKVFPIKILCEL